ncbi:MAG: esterase-like activity of phytase family protein [Candidatus Binatia bacterium]
MTSPDRDFGGLSGLLVSADGTRFIAVSDEANWVTGSLEYEGGQLVRAVGDTIAPLLDAAGEPLDDKAGDAEGLASADGNDITGELFVSFEGHHRVWRYPFAESGVKAVPTGLPLPPEVLMAPNNGGIEGITRIAEGRLFAVTERYRDRAGDYRTWVLPYDAEGLAAPPNPPPGSPDRRAVAIRPIAPFAMTDVRLLPGGDLLTLERRYSTAHGVGVQLRLIPRAVFEEAVNSGRAAPLDGQVIANFDAGFEIDNMEGLAVRRGDTGETLVYALSDDNFNRPVQRTLLVMYELLP